MTGWLARKDATSEAVYGIDRMVRNVRTGRFERSLAALTAAGALVTAAASVITRNWRRSRFSPWPPAAAVDRAAG